MKKMTKKQLEAAIVQDAMALWTARQVWSTKMLGVRSVEEAQALGPELGSIGMQREAPLFDKCRQLFALMPAKKTRRQAGRGKP